MSRRSRIRPSRLATAERARQKLADWPAAHYGYRIAEVRDALAVLDEVIAQLRVAMGITQLRSVPERERAAGPAAAAAAAAADRRGAGRAVRRRGLDRRFAGRAHRPAADGDAADRSRDRLAARRMGDAHAPHRERRSRSRAAQSSRPTTTCARARWMKRPSWPRAAGRRISSGCARRSRKKIAASAASAPATSPRCWRRSICRRRPRSRRATRARNWSKRAPVFRRYRRSTNGAFKVFDDAAHGARAGQGDERAAGQHHRSADETAGVGQQELQESGAARRARAVARASSPAPGSWPTTRSACACRRCRPTASTSRSAPRPPRPAR